MLQRTVPPFCREGGEPCPFFREEGGGGERTWKSAALHCMAAAAAGDASTRWTVCVRMVVAAKASDFCTTVIALGERAMQPLMLCLMGGWSA